MHITILGCGQLARLMALAGKKMAIDFTFVAIDNESTRCVDKLAKIVHWSKHVSTTSLLQAIGETDVVTVEREDIDIRLLLDLSMRVNVFPRPESVAICQNRIKEKIALSQLNIASTPWFAVTDTTGLFEAAKYLNYPFIIKSAEHGYDGKNQARIKDENALNEYIDNFIEPNEKIKAIAEPIVEFDTEVSLIGVRALSGEVKFYPLTENHHVGGILRRSMAPADFIPEDWLQNVKRNMTSLLEKWQYVGVLTMELFVTKDGIMVNELAPRIHNSGHWTDEGSVTSQFENHIRAISGLSLGSTMSKGYSAMVNILGTESESAAINLPETSVHLYNKMDKPGRKLGHINLSDPQRNSLLNKVKLVEQTIYSGNGKTFQLFS
ncbi:5-(carboxyamino)imidazole ribonucleotide synthase [Aliikangiella coralliicola]|uniref:N5-carboxyaminoimidazole ribonucleotide synthase n=1 Tax=Aliikangiella coralliicola TaxID=2592383 RepID=A0A545U4G3_9GAMM|nr:5-(carboxyamino)imidazole ribonucleotide synthase [Aliikangiella coralliicola]TQV84334.1 5-(carboxyamino)imidazole ribonucleotide synthase [Aliikangiella coralliicola]